MKERILFVAVGQGGGNITQLFENAKYHCLFLNTAYDDLKTIKAKHKLHLVGTLGCNKDRGKAIEYAQEHYEMITEVIDLKFPQQDIIFFVFTAGGGTGSGLSPILLDYMSNKFPEKHFGAIVALPSLKESIKCQNNALEVYKELKNIEGLSLHIIDNNNGKDLKEINKKFFERFDRLVNITNPDERGIIDKAELETLLTCPGSTFIDIIPSNHSLLSKDYRKNLNLAKGINIAEKILENLDNNPYTQFEYGCKYSAFSIAGEVQLDNIEDIVGIPLDTFKGYNDKSTLVVFTGQPFPQARIKELYNNVKKMCNQLSMDMKEENEFEMEDINIESLYDKRINKKNKVNKTKKNIKDNKIDVLSIFNKYAKVVQK